MPKGRDFVPSNQRDGVWFPHRGMGVCHWPPKKDSHTSTGEMLTAPFNDFTAAYPPTPPRPYHNKHEQRNFKLSNNFSNHDNRHSFQDHGVYFGDGRESRPLGKRLSAPTKRQHFTDKDYLKHKGRQVTHYDYNTQYGNIYQGCAGASTTVEPPTHRRFPKLHKEGTAGPQQPLDTATTMWFQEPDVPYKTPLQVMATAQEPFLGPNKWKYSNHGLSRCYPPYERPEQGKISVWRVSGPQVMETAKVHSQC